MSNVSDWHVRNELVLSNTLESGLNAISNNFHSTINTIETHIDACSNRHMIIVNIKVGNHILA